MSPIRAILGAVEAVRGSISGGPLAVLDALRPLLLEYASDPMILTDEKRAEIQGRVLETLRDARLIPTAEFGGGE